MENLSKEALHQSSASAGILKALIDKQILIAENEIIGGIQDSVANKDIMPLLSKIQFSALEAINFNFKESKKCFAPRCHWKR